MTKKNKVSEILAKIRKDEIQPVPKWQCRLFNWSFWLATAVAIILSSIFFSIILINLFEIPLETFRYMQVGRYLRVLFGIFPFAWLFLVVSSLILGLAAFHKTKYGYRYNFVLLMSGFLLISLIFGFGLHGISVNKPLREFGENQMPHNIGRGPFDKAQKAVFIEDGLLGGEIIRRKENRIFIKNLLNEEWEIIHNEKTKIKKEVKLIEGDYIVIVGEKVDEFLFEAFAIKKMKDCPHCHEMPPEFSR